VETQGVPQIQTRISPPRLVAAAAAVAIFSLISTASAQVAAIVDGQSITELDIQQRAKFHEMATHKNPNRQDIIDELSNEIQEIWQAEHHAIAPSDAEVSEAFAHVASKMAIDSEKLTEILANGGSSAATLKQQLRANIAKAGLERGGYDLRGIGN
jgi:peptidyl-prolyl cis-trans isomerase SurA